MINNFKHFDVQIFFLQYDKSNPNSIDDILLKKVAGYFFYFFHLLLMIGMLRQRFCCWRASHKIRHKQNKHIIEKTNKQNTKQLIFNFLILNALNVITKSILVVLFIQIDCICQRAKGSLIATTSSMRKKTLTVPKNESHFSL